MKINRVLAIHTYDLCSTFGRCSLTAAIPVLSALGSQVCPFPDCLSAIASLTYGKFHRKDLTDEMTSSMDKCGRNWAFPFVAILQRLLARVRPRLMWRD